MSRKTVGAISSELIMGMSDDTHSAHDQSAEHLREYEHNVELAVEAGKKKHDGDFFVVVLTKKERLMRNVLRFYYFSRQTCPSPEWDQTVYHYHIGSDHIEYLWTVPSKDTCQYLKDFALELPPDEHELLRYVFDFDDGTLLNKAKQLNGELNAVVQHA